ncbi:patatin-like phospholipase family protein [Neisseria bacilliformis]|uniref:patatin-like phospholipase family protein n=1 Tax=Neisseria bacilliformis TaxID=267212 RepID=UPI0028E1F792|nr:patatin-like phospholipase family protein [Neisseria bacilliformis]
MHANAEKTGLVLSGGGAKGAYQAGVLRALAEMDIAVDAVAGASIGALNGAVVASAPSLPEAAEHLEKVWQRLSEIKPLQLNGVNVHYKKAAVYLAFLASAGLRFSNPWINAVLPVAQKGLGWLIGSDTVSLEQNALFTDQPLQTMLNEFLDIHALQNGLPLYVSVFEQHNFISGAADWLKAEFLGIDNPPSRFEHIQSLPPELQKETLLASAALPLLFKSRTDENGVRLTDGGQGGWIKAQGNTPVTPLVEAGYGYIIVSHLDNGALWHREDFPNTTFIEIRPNPKLDLGISATLDFAPHKIEMLKQCGYEDTLNAVGRIKESLDALRCKRSREQEREQSMKELADSMQALKNAAEKLKDL